MRKQFNCFAEVALGPKSGFEVADAEVLGIRPQLQDRRQIHHEKGEVGSVGDSLRRDIHDGSNTLTYDNNGNRISQTIFSVVTDYLLDTQPALVQVIAATIESNTERYLHGPRGIHAMQDASGNWIQMLQDGLGSVHAEVNGSGAVVASQNYTPYGEPINATGSFASPFEFAGQQTDGTGQIYLRARYYDPGLSVFTALDPFEGTAGRPCADDLA